MSEMLKELHTIREQVIKGVVHDIHLTKPVVYVDNRARGRSGHMSHAMTETGGRLLDNTYHTINVLAERKPTDVQLHCLIWMIEEGLPSRPTIDEVYESFEAAMRAEEVIIS